MAIRSLGGIASIVKGTFQGIPGVLQGYSRGTPGPSQGHAGVVDLPYIYRGVALMASPELATMNPEAIHQILISAILVRQAIMNRP